MEVILETEKCIGCGTCEALCNKFFQLKDGKSHLKGGRKAGDTEELEIKEKGCLQEAAENCPVQCIHIK